LFGFIYSKRKGTVAEKMDEQVPITIKRERVNILLNTQREIEKVEVIKNIGKTQRVIMETCQNGKIFAKNEVGQKVQITNGDEFDFKIDFVDVKITDVKKNVLIAQIIR
jgi:tRNA-2-methylthio-N6-dimethylallyladenosine synthase